MAKTPKYARYVDAEKGLHGFSSIAPGFWRSAEKLRDEAIQQTKGQSWPTHWTTHSIICLYHAALDCFINEEITLKAVLAGSQLSNTAYEIQGMTLNAKKLDAFFSHCGLAGKQTPEVRRRTLLLIGLRNRLSHHWPEMRDVRDYPVDVIDALTDAKIEKLNTSWTAQCSDVRLATWAAEIVRAFIDEWWQLGRTPDKMDHAHWEYGPDWVYPSKDFATAQ